MGYTMPRERSRRVGVIVCGADGMLLQFMEKPDPREIPGDEDTIIGNIGYYGFGPKFSRPLADEIRKSRAHGEHLITDPIEAAAKEGQSFYVHRIDSRITRRFDGGKFYGLRAAGNFATEHAAFRPAA